MDNWWDESWLQESLEPCSDSDRASACSSETTAARPVLQTLHQDATVLVVHLQTGHSPTLFGLPAGDSIAWWHQVFSVLDKVLAAHNLTKHHSGWATETFCVSAGVNEPMSQHTDVAAQCARDLIEAARSMKLPDGSALPLGIGMDSGILGDGLIGSPGNLQYHLVGRPVALAQELARQAPVHCLLMSAAAHSRLTLDLDLPSVGPLPAGVAGQVDCYLAGDQQGVKGLSNQKPAFVKGEGAVVSNDEARNRPTAHSAVSPQAHSKQAGGASSAPHTLGFSKPQQHTISSTGTRASTMFLQTPWLQYQDTWLEATFLQWYGSFYARQDMVVAVLYSATGIARTLWLMHLRVRAGQNPLTPLFLLLPVLLACLCTLLLQTTSQQGYRERRGVLTAATRVYQTAYLLGTASIAASLKQPWLGPGTGPFFHNIALILGLQSLAESSLAGSRFVADALCLGLALMHFPQLAGGGVSFSIFMAQAVAGLAGPALVLLLNEKRTRHTFQHLHLSAKKLA